jgi:hypothetical protein
VQQENRAAQLIDGLAPYFAGEAEVFRTYWTWSKRTRETDRRWLARQCWKEIWGSGVARTREGLFLGAARELVELFPRIDAGVGRRDVLALVESLRSEFAHYCAFADAHDALASSGEPALSPRELTGWPEDDRLAELRFAHKREAPRLGERAARITEGGFGTLYLSGMGLSATTTGPHAHANAVIAAACRAVYDEERGHMAAGLRGIESEDLCEAEWRALEEMAVAQARCRIDMRNAQFGNPLAGERLEAARDGRLPAALGNSAYASALTATVRPT